ncbi:alkaline phosphatase [Bifidobacterium pseudocatenulatum]|uniref:alkaline phosphatase n=1 Tax=Bifidobacterium pseudocatenulatum TaxID=28026 RepID=UPI0034A2B529
MSNRKALKGAIAAIASVATLGALAAPALADETTTYNLNGKSVAELAQHGGAQRIAAIGNGNAKNVILFIGDGMGDSEITVARDYLKGANGHFEGLDAVGQSAELGDTNAGTGQYTTPAVLESHSTERGCYGPQGKTDGSSNDALKRCLANQLKENGGIGSISEQLLDTRADVTIGGGSKYFRQTVQGGEYAGKTVWEQAKEMGYQTVENDSAAMNALEYKEGQPVLALMSDGNMPTKFNPSKATAQDPAKDANPTVCTMNDKWLGNQGSSLKDMTKKALDLLEANPASDANGYFLQVEGASIDKQDHAGNACGQIGETDDFDQAIAYAMKNVDLTNTLVIVTADHAHTSQILNAQPAYALSTVLKTADGNNMVVSYGTAEADSRDEDGGYNGGDMAHTGTQLRIAASGPGAQRVIGLTDQTDNFYTIANTLGLASTSDDQKSLSNDAKTEVKLTDGKYVAESTGFNGDAVLSYELKDKSGNVLAASDSSTPVSGVRVKTAQTTSIALDKVAEGNEYTLTVTGRQSGKTVTVDFQAPARDSSDEKPGDGKNDVIASGKVSNNPKSGVLGNTGAAITIAALAIAMLAAIAMIVKTAKISR